jgi:ELMO domain-containing protein
MLETLHSWKHAIYMVETVRKTPYSSQSPQHEAMLMDLWKQLRPNRNIKGRKSEEWIELGFQVDDPATDFRGAGVLGLTNLHAWVGTEEGKAAFRVADTPGTDYFFASASLFLTMLSVELLKGVQITPYYWVPRAGEGVEWLFQQLFEEVFR